MLSVIKDLIAGVSAWFRWQANRQERLNSPDIQANERARLEAEIRNKANAAVKNDDIETIRKMGS